MSEWAAVVFAVPAVVALLCLVQCTCQRTPSLAPWKPVLWLMAILWCVTVYIKLFYLDRIIPPVDGWEHDRLAREVAGCLRGGEWSTALSYCGIGNRGYQFILGTFYAATSAPQGVVYLINACLGYWGMLWLLETVCRMSASPRVPLWVAVAFTGLPSALYWTTANLKEGAILWGICMMLRALPDGQVGRRSRVWPATGISIVMVLRPHIGLAWMASLGAGSMFRRFSLSFAAATALALMCGVYLLKEAAPNLVDAFQMDGITHTIVSYYDTRAGLGNSMITHIGGAPVPIVTGLGMLFLRPLPSEVFDRASALAGIEIWAITTMIVVNWLRCRQISDVLRSPGTVTAVVALLSLSLFFSFSYNMGLLVRQRIVAVPALLMLAALPCLMRMPKKSTGDRPPGLVSTNGWRERAWARQQRVPLNRLCGSVSSRSGFKRRRR